MRKNRGVLPEMTNPGADRVRRIRTLTTSAGRRRHRSFIVEGPQAVRELVDHAPVLVRDVYLTVEASQRHPEILDGATAQSLYLHLCSPEVIEAMSPDAQGVVAVADSPDRSETDFSAQGAAGGRFFAALIEARDPGNAGTIIRTADAAGAAGVVLSSGSVSVENPKVIRSTAGSLFHLPVTTGRNPEQIVQEAKEAGLQVLATSTDGQHNLEDPGDGLDLGRPTLWLFGNEAHGLPVDVLALADATVSIPIHGHAESLNLAMAATLCLYASARHGGLDHSE